jgi:hypothetical protein
VDKKIEDKKRRVPKIRRACFCAPRSELRTCRTAMEACCW